MTKNNPKLLPSEIVVLCAKKWTNVDESTKQKLQSEYMKDKEQFIKQRAQYEVKLTDEQKYEIEAAKQDLVESKAKRAYKKVRNLLISRLRSIILNISIETSWDKQTEETCLWFSPLSSRGLCKEWPRRSRDPT